MLQLFSFFSAPAMLQNNAVTPLGDGPISCVQSTTSNKYGFGWNRFIEFFHDSRTDPKVEHRRLP